MTPWARVPYAVATGLAEGIAALMPRDGQSKLVRSLAARRGIMDRYRRWGAAHRAPDRPLLWIHAPSVGEGLMALPVIRGIRAERPTTQIAYTFFSPSAERFALSLGADFTDYLPFDHARTVDCALAALQPTALVFSKLDVWPVLAEHAHRRGVALGLVSASFPAQSSRRGLATMLTRDAYAALDLVGAVSADDARHITEAGTLSERIRVTGDTRYDQAWARAHEQRPHAALVDALRDRDDATTLEDNRGSLRRFTLVAGSTWPADEAVLFPAWERVVAERRARLIIAPHEIDPAHLDTVERWATRTGASCRRLGAPDAAAADVLLVDRVGVLADLYALGDVAYVGGGFHRAGLHSVVEPAVFGVPVIVGPRHGASRDARLMLAAGGAVAVHDIDTMARTLNRLATTLTDRQTMCDALRRVVAAELGAAGRSLEIVRELLGPV